MSRLSELPWLLLMWLGQRRRVEGSDVWVAGSADDAGEVFTSVGAALQLIAKHGPRFSARLQRDVKRVLFAEVSGGRYLAGLQTCLIGVAYARRVAPLDLAMTIVHEATHGRLSRAGFRYEGECRERIERLCVGQEIAFAEQVPGSEAAVEKTRALLQTRWWTPEKTRQATMDELRELGVPAWLTHILRWVRRRRT